MKDGLKEAAISRHRQVVLKAKRHGQGKGGMMKKISCASAVMVLACLLCTAIAADVGKKWRNADERRMERLTASARALVDQISANPLDLELLSNLEVMCKDHSDHNSRFRFLHTIQRIDPGLKYFISINLAYALGDRLFSHAKACRFDETERDLRALFSMFRTGKWNEALGQGMTLPILPFYALVFDFSMTEVTQVSKSWATQFGNNRKKEELPSPFSNVYLHQFDRSRMLKIGYVSSDIYRVHPVGKSINALLRMLNPAEFEVYGFLLIGSQLDDATDLEQGTGGVMLVDLSISSSAEAALAINDEGIHILIDLNGHTSGVSAPSPCPHKFDFLDSFSLLPPPPLNIILPQRR